MTFHILRIPEKTDGLPYPRRGRCPHRPAAPAPVDLQASGSEKRSRGNTTTTPTTSAPSATGRQSQESQKRIACPKARQNRRLHRSVDSRQRGGTKVPERAKRFSLWTVRLRSRWRLCRLRMRHTPCGYGPFSFPQDGKENGGCILHGQCPLREQESPWAAVRRPTSPRAD